MGDFVDAQRGKGGFRGYFGEVRLHAKESKPHHVFEFRVPLPFQVDISRVDTSQEQLRLRQNY